MEVEFTARKIRVSKGLREQAQEAMDRMARYLGRNAHASFVFGAQKREFVVELTIQARLQTIAAEGKSPSLELALKMALEHAANQARRQRDRKMGSKRLPKEEKVLSAPPVARPKTLAVPTEKVAKPVRARAAIAVHSFPVRKVEPHLITSSESIALKPMTIEEAVKEIEFRDRELLIFRNAKGVMFVLHRRKNGQIELVEVPS